MSRMMSLMGLLSLVACGSADGEWLGECAIDESGVSIDMSLEISSAGRDLAGDAIAGFDDAGYLYFREGEISGTRKGSDVEITIEFDNGSEMSLSAVQSKDTMDGSCVLDGMDGDLELDR